MGSVDSRRRGEEAVAIATATAVGGVVVGSARAIVTAAGAGVGAELLWVAVVHAVLHWQ